MKFYFTYLTTNLSNGKKYIGQHCTKNFNDGYFGSSKKLKRDVKNGDSYYVEILNFFENIWELGHAEFEEIKKRNAVNDATYYNEGNFLYFNKHFEFGRKKLSLETRKKISENNVGMLGKKHSLETRKKISESCKGRKHSLESKRKMSESMKGKNKGRKLSLETRKKMSESMKGKNKGRKLSLETRKKMSESLKKYYATKSKNLNR